MQTDILCPLCESPSEIICKERKKTYQKCLQCNSIFMDPKFILTCDEELEKYETHNNDVNDPRYQNFVFPIVDSIVKYFSPMSTGLDFGCGPGPVISKLLSDKNYNIKQYDPFYCSKETNIEVIKNKYDYIACCEVVEHFSNPAKEFKLILSLLKPKGKIYIKTHPFDKKTDFSKWYYKHDPTHIFFYSKETFEWIQNHFGFNSLFIDDRLIILGVE